MRLNLMRAARHARRHTLAVPSARHMTTGAGTCDVRARARARQDEHAVWATSGSAVCRRAGRQGVGTVIVHAVAAVDAQISQLPCPTIVSFYGRQAPGARRLGAPAHSPIRNELLSTACASAVSSLVAGNPGFGLSTPTPVCLAVEQDIPTRWHRGTHLRQQLGDTAQRLVGQLRTIHEAELNQSRVGQQVVSCRCCTRNASSPCRRTHEQGAEDKMARGRRAAAAAGPTLCI